MFTRTLSSLLLCSLFLASSLLTTTSFAHTDDINQATLSLENNEHYQLVVTVDFIHLLKQHLAINGADNKIIQTLSTLSFLKQKQLLEQLTLDISQQTHLKFGDTQQAIGQLQGLQLQLLKRIISQPESLGNYKVSLRTAGDIPSGVNEIAIQFSPLLGDIVLNVVRPEHEMLSRNSLSQNYQIAPPPHNTKVSAFKLAGDYLYQGFIHILPRGLDHILFVLALLLFVKSKSSLIWQISVFTLAHTITLALGVYGVISLPSDIVEPLIALSIAYVGLENIYRAKSNSVSLSRLPVIFAFGLLHGLGFASVLADVGLPPSQYILSLVSFNLGVELGQLTVIAIAYLCLLGFRAKSWYQTRLVLALNVAIAVIAAYWFIERIT